MPLFFEPIHDVLPTPVVVSGNGLNDPLGRYLHPHPRPVVKVRLRKAVPSLDHPTTVEVVEHEDRLLLVLVEGIYVGDPNSSTYRAWFVPWEDVDLQTIPPHLLPSGHPST